MTTSTAQARVVQALGAEHRPPACPLHLIQAGPQPPALPEPRSRAPPEPSWQRQRLRVGSHSAPVLRELCKDLGSVSSRGAKSMTRVDRHSVWGGGAEVGMETPLPPPKRGKLSSASTGSSQASSAPCGNQAHPPSSSQKESSVESGQVALHHSGWGFGRSPSELSALSCKIMGTSQPAGLGLGF